MLCKYISNYIWMTITTAKYDLRKSPNWPEANLFQHAFFLSPPDCDKSCLTCSNHRPSSCLTCPSGRQRDASGQCVWFKQCPKQHYKDQDGECRHCNGRCRLCSGSGPNQCLSCEEPYLLFSKSMLQHEMHIDPSLFRKHKSNLQKEI